MYLFKWLELSKFFFKFLPKMILSFDFVSFFKTQACTNLLQSAKVRSQITRNQTWTWPYYSMIGAYCYAELGCLIKKSGGDYSYILDTFGPFVGFVRLWAECLVVRPCTITIVALTFSTYACKPFFPECEPPDEAIRTLAALCICKSLPQNYWHTHGTKIN